jgi:hypothetical protein
MLSLKSKTVPVKEVVPLASFISPVIVIPEVVVSNTLVEFELYNSVS